MSKRRGGRGPAARAPGTTSPRLGASRDEARTVSAQGEESGEGRANEGFLELTPHFVFYLNSSSDRQVSCNSLSMTSRNVAAWFACASTACTVMTRSVLRPAETLGRDV